MANKMIDRLGNSKTRTLLLLGGVFVIAIVVIVIMSTRKANPAKLDESHTAKIPQITAIPGNITSEKYQELQAEDNRRRSEQAKTTGGSSVATIIGSKDKDSLSQKESFGIEGDLLNCKCPGDAKSQCEAAEFKSHDYGPLIAQVKANPTDGLRLLKSNICLAKAMCGQAPDLAYKIIENDKEAAAIMLKDCPELAKMLAEKNPALFKQVMLENPALARQMADKYPGIMKKLMTDDPEFASKLAKVSPEVLKSLMKTDPDFTAQVAAKNPEMLKELMSDPEFAKSVAKNNPALVKRMMLEDPEFAKKMANANPAAVKELMINDTSFSRQLAEKSPTLVKELMKNDPVFATTMMKANPDMVKKLMANDPDFAKSMENIAMATDDPAALKKRMLEDPEFAKKMAESNPELLKKLMKEDPVFAKQLAEKDPTIVTELMKNDPVFTETVKQLLKDDPAFARKFTEKNPEVVKSLMKEDVVFADEMGKANPEMVKKLMSDDPGFANVLGKNNQAMVKKLIMDDPTFAKTMIKNNSDMVKELMKNDADFARHFSDKYPTLMSELTKDPAFAKIIEGLLKVNPKDEQAKRARQVMLNEAQQKQIAAIMANMEIQSKPAYEAWSQVNEQKYVAGDKKDNKSGDGSSGVDGSGTGVGSTKTAPSGPVLIKAGTIIFAVLDTAVNTDEPGPVMGTIIQGPYKGSKVLGDIQLASGVSSGGARPEKVILNFNTLSNLSAGLEQKSLTIKAVAIDPDTARTALASSVDHHYLLRYGTMFASSFMNGYAKVITSAGTTQVNSGTGSTTTVTPTLSPRQQIFAALGQVGKSFSDATATYFSTPNTISVKSGTGFGLLILSDVTSTGN